MPDETIIDLVRYRISSSRQCLESSKKLLEIQDWKASANRSYYAVFHAMRAMLALERFDSKKHSGIISEFRRLYIKTGIVPVELSDIASELFDARSSSDYEDFYILTKHEVEEQLEHAYHFVNTVNKYLDVVLSE